MRDWSHSPAHALPQTGAYMLTAGTYFKQPFFRGAERLDYLCALLLELAESYRWELQAWAVFPNHYHLVAFSPPGAASLEKWTRHLHSVTAIQVNRWDRSPGRKVWFQYWDTPLTFSKSYFARLGYVHRNAVHHGLVREASLYQWCSAGWLARHAPASFYKGIMAMNADRVNVEDDFEIGNEDVGRSF